MKPPKSPFGEPVMVNGRLYAAPAPKPTKPIKQAKKPKGSTPFKIQWTLADSLAAQKQGWDLFSAYTRFEIEVVTENTVGFSEGADDDAVAWIIKMALRGDKTCIKGLLIAGLLDPQWFASDLTHVVKTGRVTVLNTKKKSSAPYSEVEYRIS